MIALGAIRASFTWQLSRRSMKAMGGKSFSHKLKKMEEIEGPAAELTSIGRKTINIAATKKRDAETNIDL